VSRICISDLHSACGKRVSELSFRRCDDMWPFLEAADNAAMESFFFSLPQHNVANRRRWATRDGLHIAIVIWINRTHRRQTTLPAAVLGSELRADGC
jgi:hypothetical protein